MTIAKSPTHGPAGYRLVDVTEESFDALPCCGIKLRTHPGRLQKRCWLKQNAGLGLRAKTLIAPSGEPGGYIEYAPGEHAWRGIEADGYLVIHCIWIYNAHREKGCGRLMIDDCLREARRAGRSGVAVVVRDGPWMADGRLFVENGFELADTAPPDFQLLVRKFDRRTKAPKFRRGWEIKQRQYGSGLVIVRSGQCPHSAKFVEDIAASARQEYHIEPTLVDLETPAEAQNCPTPYGTFALLLDGRLIADHPISRTRFRNIMNRQAV